MRRIIGIVESEAAPKNKLEMWLFKGNLKYFGPNGWQSVGSGASSIKWDDISDKPDFANVATSGSYNDLKDTPTIPPAYTLPAATTTVVGGVKMAENVGAIDASTATIAIVAGSINVILAMLKAAGIMAKDTN